MRGSVVVGKVLTYLFLVLAGLVLIYPLLYMTLASFLSQEEYITYIAGTSILPIPVRLYLGTYGELLVGSGPLVTALQVTLRREVWFIASGLLVSLFGGYAFSRLRFPGRDAMFMFFLTALMVPGMLISIPVYVMMARFPFVGGNSASGVGGHGFLNSWAALFILGNVPAFLVFLNVDISIAYVVAIHHFTLHSMSRRSSSAHSSSALSFPCRMHVLYAFNKCSSGMSSMRISPSCVIHIPRRTFSCGSVISSPS